MEKKSLYTYSLSGASSSRKVMFVYALKGRNKDKGLVKELNGEFLANSCFIADARHDGRLESFFRYWHISFKRMHIAIVD